MPRYFEGKANLSYTQKLVLKLIAEGSGVYAGCDQIMAVEIKSKSGEKLKVKVNFRTVWALFGKGMLALDGRSKAWTRFILSPNGRVEMKNLDIPKEVRTLRELPDFDF